MAAFRLPRLPRDIPIVNKAGAVLPLFQQWWQSVVVKIEKQEESQNQIIEDLAAAQATLEATQIELSAAQAEIIAAQADIIAAQADIDGLDTGKQPLDDDLTAIAALTTQAFGRSLLTLADGPALTAEIDPATLTDQGAMSAADKTKLDGITAGANVIETQGTWAPSASPGSGSSTFGVPDGWYTKIGREVHMTAVVPITNAGTGTGPLNVSLPFAAAAGPSWVGQGRENAVTGSMLQGSIGSGSSSINILTYNNGSPIGTGHVVIISASYWV